MSVLREIAAEVYDSNSEVAASASSLLLSFRLGGLNLVILSGFGNLMLVVMIYELVCFGLRTLESSAMSPRHSGVFKQEIRDELRCFYE